MSNTDSAFSIVQRSITEHGGLQAWNDLQDLSYRKTVILFDSTGCQESSITQFHHYNLLAPGHGTIWWKEGEDSISISYGKHHAIKWLNGKERTDSVTRVWAMNTVLSAHFVLFQPFKLLDPGALLSYQGVEILEDSTQVDVVKVTYGDDPDLDQWWFYFNRSTGLVEANMVKHRQRYSYIRNLSYDKNTSLIFNKHRRSYFTDSLRRISYLRAEYFYDDFRVNQSP